MNVQPDSIKKEIEFIGAVVAEAENTIDVLSSGKDKSALDEEIIFLKNILDTYIRNKKVFLEHFVSGVEGERGVDLVIAGLEHPDSKIAKDPDLISKLRGIIAQLRKKRLLDSRIILFYKLLVEEAKRLSSQDNYSEFCKGFTKLIQEAGRYADSEIARSLKNPKETPKINKLLHIDLSVQLFTFLVIRLARSDQISSIARKLKVEQGFDNLFARAAAILSMTPAEFAKEANKCFTKQDQIEKLVDLGKAINNEGAHNIFIRFLVGLHLPGLASRLEKEFSGGKADPATVLNLARLAQAIEGSKDYTKTEAINEFVSLIEKSLGEQNAKYEWCNKAFDAAISGRIAAIKHEIPERLKNLEEQKEKLEKMNSNWERIMLAADEYARDALKYSNTKQQDAFALDIVTMFKAWLQLRWFERGAITSIELEKNFNNLRAEAVSPAIKMAVDSVYALCKERLGGMISKEEYAQKSAKVNGYVSEVQKRLTLVCTTFRESTRRVVEDAERLKDAALLIEPGLSRAIQQAHEVHKLSGLTRREVVKPNLRQ